MRRFFPYLKYLRLVRRQLWAAVLFGVIMALASGASLPILIKYVFPRIFDHTHGAMPLSRVVLWAAAIPVAFLVRAVSGYLNSYFIQHSGIRILEAIRTDYFRKLQVLSLSFVQGKSSGDLIARGMSDTSQLQTTLTTVASDGIKQPLTLLAALGLLVWFAFTTQGVGLVLISLAIVPVSVLPVRYVGKKVVKRAHQLQSHLGSVTGHFSENLAAAREVRAFGLEGHEIGRFAAASRELVTAQTKIAKYSQAITPAIEFIAALGISVTLIYAYVTGIDLATFVAICTALYMSYEPVKKIGGLNNELKRGRAALDRLEFVLHAPVSITDPETPVDIGRLRGDITFERVDFAYNENEPVRQSSRPTSRLARCAPLSAPAAPERPPLPISCRDSMIPRPAAWPSTASTCARSGSPTCGAISRWFRRIPCSSTTPFSTTSFSAAPTPPATR